MRNMLSAIPSDSGASPPQPAASARGGIAVVDKAMAMVNLVAGATHPMTFTDLVRRSGLPKATLHRILATLLAQGLLRIEPRDRTYRLGLRILELAHRVWAEFDLRVAAEDELARLAEATGETVRLGVLDGAEVIVVSRDAPGEVGELASGVGERLPFHATALGKSIACCLEPPRQQRLLESSSLFASTPATLTTVAALRTDLNLARARGYAIEDGEHAADTRGVAVAVLDHAGRPLGAIDLTGPASRLDTRTTDAPVSRTKVRGPRPFRVVETKTRPPYHSAGSAPPWSSPRP